MSSTYPPPQSYSTYLHSIQWQKYSYVHTYHIPAWYLRTDTIYTNMIPTYLHTVHIKVILTHLHTIHKFMLPTCLCTIIRRSHLYTSTCYAACISTWYLHTYTPYISTWYWRNYTRLSAIQISDKRLQHILLIIGYSASNHFPSF